MLVIDSYRCMFRSQTGSAPSVGDPYTWFTGFNKNDFPPHAAGGVWGAQSTVKEASAPTGTMVDVTAANATELATHIYTANRRITLTGNITSASFLSGNITDVDIIVPPGILVSDCNFGIGDGSTTITRLRFRGNTVGSYSGGQLHALRIFGSSSVGSSDIIIDGCAISGIDGNNWGLQVGFNVDRMAVTNCRAHCGGYFYLGTASDITFTNCSIISAAGATNQNEAWGIRCGYETRGNIIVYGCDIRASTARQSPLLNNVYHRFRCHPDTDLDYVYVGNNTLIDRLETRIIWVNAAVGGGSGDALGVWIDGNTVIAATTNSSPPSIEGGDMYYAYITDNAFQSDTFLSDTNIVMSAITSTTKSGNTYASLPGSDPAWGAAGDPTGIDWTP